MNTLRILILAIFALNWLVACQDLGAPAMVKTKVASFSDKRFVFGAPDGFCLDTPTFQMRRGDLDADTVFANIDASNCAQSGRTYQPTKLTHLITISASPSETPLADNVKTLSEASGETWRTWHKGYRSDGATAGYATLDYAQEIGGFVTLTRVTSLAGTDTKVAEEILKSTIMTLESINQ